MIVDPQVRTPLDLGLFMLAPLSLGIALGTLHRWRDRRSQRSALQDAPALARTPTVALANPGRARFERAEGRSSEDRDCHESRLQTKDVA